MTCRPLLFVVVVSACVSPLDLDDTPSRLDEASTIVSLTFDDTFEEQLQAADLADARGMHLTFYVNSSRLGLAGYMTRSQLLALQADGHEIGGHTITHANLTSLAEADARGQVCNDRVALLDDGFAVTSFAYPFGANNATTDQMVEECGYNSARDVGGLVTGESCANCPYANAIPPLDLYAMRTNGSVESSTTLAMLQEYVTQAEESGGGFVPIVFHHVCNGCASNSISPALLGQFLDWLAARSPSTQVATVNEVIGGSVRPGMFVEPPDTDPPPASNLIRNPSLEADTDGNQVPDCWQRGGYGTNSATYSLVSDAYDGDVAQRITISSLSSGGRRLITAQDLGTCAPSVTAGHAYTMTAFYKATAQPRFTVYYRTTSGAWLWFAQSPLLPASSTYRQATYTTPALPADATAISLGLTIFDAGTLTMDAYGLVDATEGEPPPPPTSDNLLENASVELDGNGNQVPDCWTRGGYGTNTAAFSLVSDAYDGNVAQRVDITSWTSGGRRLVSAQDTGACAPSATPGHRYTMTAHYKATVQPRFSVYYRTAAGTWTWFAESSSLPVSSSYRQATYTTPPLPSDATAISIGLSIFGKGSITSDAYTLVDAAGEPPPPPPASLLDNASLERDANGDQVPDCWTRGGYGTNAATFSLVADAYDGNVAQRIDVTSWTSGARRLVSAQDAGACAPSVTPGRRYTMTAFYKATAAPRFSVYYRTTAGTWAWFAESSPLPTSTSYREATYTTPALPADATAISVGLSIFGVGSLTSDAYTLVEAP